MLRVAGAKEPPIRSLEAIFRGAHCHETAKYFLLLAGHGDQLTVCPPLPRQPIFIVSKAEGQRMIRIGLISLGILTFSVAALAQTYSSQQSGTPEQRAACGPDVRRLCRNLKESDGPFAYLQCFETNHSRLSSRCRGLLQGYGLYF